MKISDKVLNIIMLAGIAISVIGLVNGHYLKMQVDVIGGYSFIVPIDATWIGAGMATMAFLWKTIRPMNDAGMLTR